ncbi:hypothetical protein SDC9_74263 [bioreactor metagenome]|uniref:Uncharacterized protein n=1 Tax=bioreactor metagenome TaxID=1076179 RepID=A0A644YHF0_9ZZZZ
MVKNLFTIMKKNQLKKVKLYNFTRSKKALFKKINQPICFENYSLP